VLIVKKVLKSMANGKAPGADGVLTELLNGAKNLMPNNLKIANIVKIYKRKVDIPNNCGNYQSISLMVTAGKLMAKILNNRISQIVERITPPFQAGIKRNRKHSLYNCTT
jgi:hypothetical protein